MHRKKFLKRLFWIGGGLVATSSGINFYKLSSTPDLSLLKQNELLIAELAEMIIPRTNTPGAKDAEVGRFIIKMISDCTNRKTQNKFLAGLSDLSELCKLKYDKSFVECSFTEKQAVLKHFEKRGAPFKGIIGKAQHRFLGDSFFTTLKRYTVLGYCSSQQGATEALAYDYVPVRYIGVMTINSDSKAWAIQ